jgi:predicted 3-demethylubiquinone-9 3-methyltransferase (glyoxalase superfamily)
MTNPIFPCLWFEDNAKEAVDYYCSVFPNSTITAENTYVINCMLNGAKFMFLKGNPNRNFNDSASFVITCENQKEIDYYWQKLTDEGQEKMCGWCTDKFGVSWQIVPYNIGELLFSPTNGQNAVQAMLQMKKIDVERLLNA